MSKKAILVHGWDGDPENYWFPWLSKKLTTKGYEVIVPNMPNPEKPEIKPWVSKLHQVAGAVDEETIFIGHSIGCQTILRFLQTLPEDKKVGKVICVAGFFTLTGLKTKEEKELAEPWVETPIDFKKIKNIAPNIFAILSDNDEYVSLENKELFENNLNAKVVIEHNQGHYNDKYNSKELLAILPILGE